MRLKRYVEIIKKQGTTQSSFAKKAGISLPTLTNYINGLQRPTFKVMEKIRKASGEMVQYRDMFEAWIEREKEKEKQKNIKKVLSKKSFPL